MYVRLYYAAFNRLINSVSISLSEYFVVMSTEESEAIQLQLYPPHIQHNTNSLHNVKFLSALFSGAAAGILGLENFSGFALFLASTLLTTSFIWLVKCKGRPQKYLHGGLGPLLNPGQDNLFSFVLVWTLFYGELTSPPGFIAGNPPVPVFWGASADALLASISSLPCLFVISFRPP